MNMAVTDRTGPDDSPLILKIDGANILKINGAKFPKLGTLVCAQNKNGWNYIGAVTSIDYVASTYTILPVAIQQPGVGPAGPPSREK